jgi:hypothetical protein
LAAEPRSGDDLAQLLMEKAAGDESIPKPDRAADLPNLSPWAAELRYARQPEAVPDRSEMRSLVEGASLGGNAARGPLR